jgi:GT2 family glycosyltransferase
MFLDEGHEIVIVNNGSTDDSLSKIEKILNENMRVERPFCKILNSHENLGFAKAMNWGYGMSMGENVIFLNNDIRVTKSPRTWTNDVIRELDNNDKTLLSPTGGLLNKNLEFVYETDDHAKKWNYLSGWLLAGKRSTFDMFTSEERPFPIFMKTYFEDVFLSFRARRLNINLKLIKVPVIHLKRQTSKTMNLSEMYTSARIKFIEGFNKEGFIIE